MRQSEIFQFLKSEVEPLPNEIYGDRYRAAVYLTDGTYLPCVVFQSQQKRVDQLLKRLIQVENRPDQYRKYVELSVAGSSLEYYDIASVELSRFAWPLSLLQMVHGETVMGWAVFVVEMDDGKRFSFTTPSFVREFFDLPDGYNFSNIKTIHSDMVYTETEGIRPYHEKRWQIDYFGAKPFFTCYMLGMNA